MEDYITNYWFSVRSAAPNMGSFSVTTDGLFARLSLQDPLPYDEDGKNRCQKLINFVQEKASLRPDELESILRSNEDGLTELRRQMERLAQDWAEMASAAKAYGYAKELQSIQYPASTNNQWQDGKLALQTGIFHKRISNHVYGADIEIEEDHYRKVRYKDSPYRVEYYVYVAYIHGLPDAGSVIVSGPKKYFASKEDALRYVEGRMKFLEKRYFPSLDPVIPLEDRRYYLLHGCELPGYNYQQGL